MSKHQQQDLDPLVHVLLRHIKQPPVKTDIQTPSWVEKRFGIPKSGEEILWRLSWLIAVPAIATLTALPALDWFWFNGYPWITLVSIFSIGLIYWAFYLAASFSEMPNAMNRLVDIQFSIPPCIAFFIIVWEALSRHVS